MKIRPGFIMNKVNNVDVVVAVGEASAKFNAVITLNGSGAFLWTLLQNDVTEQELMCAMLEKYDIDEATAKRDVEAFVNKARSAGILE